MNNNSDCENKFNCGFNSDEDVKNRDLDTPHMPISDILSMIKSIDRIIFVDDVRKYDHEDIVKMCEEIDRKEKENQEKQKHSDMNDLGNTIVRDINNEQSNDQEVCDPHIGCDGTE